MVAQAVVGSGHAMLSVACKVAARYWGAWSDRRSQLA